jgi:hypothetical protein
MLIKHLENRPIGTQITYQELCAVAKRNKMQIHNVIRTATNELRQRGQFWMVVRGVGIKCVTDGEYLAMPKMRQNRIRKQAALGKRELASIDVNKLDNAQKVSMNASATALALHARIETARSRDKLLAGAGEMQKKLTMEEATQRIIGWQKKKA